MIKHFRRSGLFLLSQPEHGNADLQISQTAAPLGDVRAAALLDGVAYRTPVLRSRTLDRLVGAELFLKCENFERGGAFKVPSR
ncbi:hypothetical protein ACFLIM_27975 [Nonomuraea sp. M3C6]|uniref:Threonine dehydratase n=1 Tax=Nonomuraea marmarensis TaxID=3351344 RepID=A0ABW7AJ18_9ACTN